MKQKWIIVTTAILLFFASFLPQHQVSKAATLTDIPAKYVEEIEFLVNAGVITGYPDGTFRPNNNVTREVAVTMIGRALGLNGEQRSSKFKDVDKKSFGSGYIASAVEAGIVTGYPDGSFRPKAEMTRGAMAYLLKRAFQLEGDGETVFRDIVTVNRDLYEAIDALATNGLTNGYPKDRTYRPDEPITRVAYSLLVARGQAEKFRVKLDNAPLYERIVTVSSSLHVRSEPNASSSSIKKLTNGTNVSIYSEHGKWVFIKSGPTLGYVHSDYLSEPKPVEPDQTEDPQQPVERPKPGQHYIAIDAGHGGRDVGALGNKLIEKELNLQVAQLVEAELKKQNISVLMIRRGDEYISLPDRVTLAEQNNVDALVSIHTNSFHDEKAHGTETYYNLQRAQVGPTKVDHSKQLATFIQTRLHKALDTRDRGVKTANFAMLRTTFPSALVELAFISNKSDAKKLASAEYQQLAADAIVAGIIDYFNWATENPLQQPKLINPTK